MTNYNICNQLVIVVMFFYACGIVTVTCYITLLPLYYVQTNKNKNKNKKINKLKINRIKENKSTILKFNMSLITLYSCDIYITKI